MNSTYLNQDNFLSQFNGFWDQAAQRALQLFFYTKFFPIFSLLFGLGISMQALRLIEKEEYTYTFFARRMFGLLLFGVLHILLLWSGDVLHIYAILGFFVPLLLRLPGRLLLLSALILLIYPSYDPILEHIFNSLGVLPGSMIETYDAASVREVIREQGFVSQLSLRLAEYKANLPMLLGFLAPLAFSMFLLGLYLGKKKWHTALEELAEKIMHPMLILFLITNGYRLLFLFVLPGLDFYRDPGVRPLLIKAMVVSDVFMGLFYLWLIGWLWKYEVTRRILSPLRYAGRMALTNYLFQSVIGVFLFTSFGLGLYETLSPSQTLIIAILIFVVQVLLSRWWLTFFRYGPLEWIWRCFSYREILSLRRVKIKTIQR
ncbi:uncharacterized protein CLV82_1919 [Zeaxanthinibacter enoshimensis]|uniref:DUF418 domain-containing protein n=2 Tax=Zeaxanthinibacter enoshimensis TaxID=392009 RepID=A0A4R6TJZ2_9FLAO|nr:uncharacterized protein CLV82_1919 [Zeaxanthinibacter enoshimensis]